MHSLQQAGTAQAAAPARVARHRSICDRGSAHKQCRVQGWSKAGESLQQSAYAAVKSSGSRTS